MTLVIGFQLFDGLVICADSKESDGFTLRQVAKISHYEVWGDDEWSFGVGSAGHGLVCDDFADKVNRSLGRTPFNRDELRKIIAKEYKASHQQANETGDDISIVFGLSGNKGEDQSIFLGQGGHVAPAQIPADIGVGDGLSQFLLRNLFDHSMSCEEFARLCVSVIQLAQGYVDGVGEPIHAYYCKRGETSWRRYSQSDVVGMQRLSNHDIGQMLQDYWRSRNVDLG